MSPIDPAAHIRPEWWTDSAYLHLSALEDESVTRHPLPDTQHPTRFIGRDLTGALWMLGKTGGRDDRSERGLEALRLVEFRAGRAAAAARQILSQRTDEEEDDQHAMSDRLCETSDPDYGPPEAHFTGATFTVRLPGYSGDSISGSISVD